MLKSQNPAMLCDFYEMTMSRGYHANRMQDKIAYFDMFFRAVPDGGGFAIAAGLEQLIEYVQDLHFDDEDLDFLRAKGGFDEEFLQYLKQFRFTGDLYAVPEGTPVFPGEPVVTVRAPVIEAQLMETFLLLTVNHQSLIATKANRIVRAAAGRPVMEFGSRRAQGADGAVLGARAAYIAGCAGTACVLSDQLFGVPALGTMAHSWVQMFDSEYDAFLAYAKLYPGNATLLIDTYNVLKSGLPNAIRVFHKLGIENGGVRIDSGDVTYLTKKIRAALDEAGLPKCKIVVSNSLDEWIIRDLIMQGAQIDSFGVGERLITSKSEPVFGGVYKLVAVEENETIVPRIKVSENTEKITTPGFKTVWRLYDNETGKAFADYLTLSHETPDFTKPLELFDPIETWKRKTVENFLARPLLTEVFRNGKLVYKSPSIREIRDYCAAEIARLWDEVKRFENPHNYYVDLSDELWNMKQELLLRHSAGKD